MDQDVIDKLTAGAGALGGQNQVIDTLQRLHRGRTMLTPDMAAAALRGPQEPMFGVPQEHLQRLAGDVVPFPIVPAPTANTRPAGVQQLQRLPDTPPNVTLTPQAAQWHLWSTQHPQGR
jgi:hypothetical protein